ncbi:TPA: DUF551 domain-containing protein [Klebsiella aerogenes]|nr:DUF551 domain-containing protein [Klebsiella aerogenes]
MTSNQLAENSVIQLLNSVKLARDNAERADNRVDHSFYYALTIALEELQERRKADSEPVGEFYEDGPLNWYQISDGDRVPAHRRIPLYRHAQPAPVALKDHQMRELVNQLRDTAIQYHGTQQLREQIARVIRAAMLQAELVCTCPSGDGSLRWPCPVHPGNSLVIPDTWIPVSERMPENDVDVQIYCPGSKEQMVGYLERNEQEGYFRYATWRTGDGIYCQPSHWMPLPSAPQEVK